MRTDSRVVKQIRRRRFEIDPTQFDSDMAETARMLLAQLGGALEAGGVQLVGTKPNSVDISFEREGRSFVSVAYAVGQGFRVRASREQPEPDSVDEPLADVIYYDAGNDSFEVRPDPRVVGDDETALEVLADVVMMRIDWVRNGKTGHRG